MAKLNEPVKTHIVTALACYETPSDVVESVRERFGIDITRQQAHEYDPTSARGDQVAKKWRALFEATRKAFLEDSLRIPVVNKSVRVRRLQRMADKAERMGNMALAAQLLEQVAKEMGGSYTNRREWSGPNGGPVSARVEVEFVDSGS